MDLFKKKHICIIDTETTQDNLVADFGAIVVDLQGNIVAQCAVLVDGIYNKPAEHPLFFDSSAPSDALWSKAGADRRYKKYDTMYREGSRMLSSVASINRWLAKAVATFNPTVTAYNFAFDRDKCEKTGIDLTIFKDSFCLWHAAVGRFCNSRAYRAWVLKTHAFNSPTALGNMTYKTNAETVARFVLGDANLEDEPHTALEDAIYYELPILKACLEKSSLAKTIRESQVYNWRKFQVKDGFRAV